jgi:hypothetical protein
VERPPRPSAGPDFSCWRIQSSIAGPVSRATGCAPRFHVGVFFGQAARSLPIVKTPTSFSGQDTPKDQ